MMVGVANAECDRWSGSRLVCRGDSRTEVLSKCGPPSKVINYYNVLHEVVQIELVYDLGSYQFTRHFTFDRTDWVISIGTGDKKN